MDKRIEQAVENFLRKRVGIEVKVFSLSFILITLSAMLIMFLSGVLCGLIAGGW